VTGVEGSTTTTPISYPNYNYYYPVSVFIAHTHQRIEISVFEYSGSIYIVFPLKRSVGVKTCIRFVCKSVRFVYFHIHISDY
jgi:hypothetical protein